ncbi:MAG: integrase/recombinase XerD [Mycobacterium sp.]|jgi:site-specific recombinase XerD|nr:integrase/recombinase XerD [Mycobacterium sp.]
MTLPRCVHVSGPLESYAAGFRAELERLGYSPWSVVFALQSLAGLSRWLVARGLRPADLSSAELERFVRERRGSDPRRRTTPRGLPVLVTYLRELDVIPVATRFVADDRLARLLDEFAAFLIEERGLARGTVWYYRTTARRFLQPLVVGDDAGLPQVSVSTIRSFVIAESACRSVGSVKNTVTALRALLRFVHVRDYLDGSLADAVPAVAGWRHRPLPGIPGNGEIAALLGSCDGGSATGLRDRAIMLLLTRLGLRVGEVAALTVDDVDWRAGEILVCGKGNRCERLPLPDDVGCAIADYCRNGRRRSGSRGLFLHARAPYQALTPSAVSYVVTRACRRAGLPTVGAHRLRHAAADTLRRAGAPLFEIGQVLRHAHPVTTAGYGSVATAELSMVIMPWPVGGAR